MTFQSKISDLGEALSDLTELTFHYWRPAPRNASAYIVWSEDGERNSFSADNRKAQQPIHGTIDLFSKTEYDPLVDSIQELLNDYENLSWRLSDVQFENETNFIHHTWEWWLR